MDAKTLNFLITFGLPLLLIFLMSIFMMRGSRARQDEAVKAYRKEMEIHEENNRLLKELVKTMKKLEKTAKNTTDSSKS